MEKRAKILVEVLATGFYAGKSPLAPGTCGTIVALPLVWWMLSSLSPTQYMGAALLLVILAIFISDIYDRHKGQHDSQEIVIDEVVGMVITMTWLPLNITSLMAGFVLFRLFDALKPFPISMIDRKIQGGVGVVADDIAAGLIANFILQIVYTKTSWLGVQLVMA